MFVRFSMGGCSPKAACTRKARAITSAQDCPKANCRSLAFLTKPDSSCFNASPLGTSTPTCGLRSCCGRRLTTARAETIDQMVWIMSVRLAPSMRLTVAPKTSNARPGATLNSSAPKISASSSTPAGSVLAFLYSTANTGKPAVSAAASRSSHDLLSAFCRPMMPPTKPRSGS